MRRLLIFLSSLLLAFTTACGSASPSESGQEVGDDASVSDDVLNSGEPAPAAPPADSPVRVGEIEEEFPVDLFAIISDDEILLSSISTPDSSDETQNAALSLNIRTARDADEVLEDFTKTLKDAGFEVTSESQVEGMSAQATYANGDQVLTVGILDESDSRIVSIGGTVTLPAAD